MNKLPKHLQDVARTFGLFFAGHPYWRDMVMDSQYRERELIEIYLGRPAYEAKIPWNPISEDVFTASLQDMHFNIPQKVVDLLDRPKRALEAAL